MSGANPGANLPFDFQVAAPDVVFRILDLFRPFDFGFFAA
jgi:hypothetical protein